MTEVGVDVPGMRQIMTRQEAGPPGLRPAHQLRGRGRGAEQSHCLLIRGPGPESPPKPAQARLEQRPVEGRTDNLERAERDLELAGEAQLPGRGSPGVVDLRFTRLRADRALLELARDLARTLVEEDGPWHDEADQLLAGADLSSLA